MSPQTTGIVYICAGAMFLVVNDALAKYLTDSLPVLEIIFFRMLFALPMVVLIGLVVGGKGALTTSSPGLQIVRGVSAIAAPVCYISGLAILPLGASAAISFASPLFITLLAVPLLGERPDWRQWVAALMGFGGVVCVIQPGSGLFSWGAMFPLAAALAYALLMLSARTLATRGDSIWVTMLYATAVPLVISGALMPWLWRTPAADQWPALIAVGVFGGGAIALITQAFRVASASVVAPFDYTGLVWAALFGWVFWGDIPTLAAFIGMFIIIGSGIYLAWRQGAQRRRPDRG